MSVTNRIVKESETNSDNRIDSVRREVEMDCDNNIGRSNDI